MRYRNSKTGTIINVKSVIVGGYWEKIKEPKAKKEAKKDEELRNNSRLVEPVETAKK